MRDYECDAQGVVNNANYQHYFENARHEYLETKGVSFSEYHDQGIDMMVSRVEIHYKQSLRGTNRFVVRLALARKGIKLVVFHELYRLPDLTLCAKGTVEIISVEQGKLTRGERFDEIFADDLKK